MTASATPATDAVTSQDVDTPVGLARLHHSHVPRGLPRATLVLGHGAGGGIGAPDLVALAAQLPPRGIAVVRVEQPWAVAGRRLAGAPARLDIAWIACLQALRGSGHGLRRLVVGGRSAGARVACRTVEATRADAVIALAFPLHPPGRPERSRIDELAAAAGRVPLLVIQGARDTFGSPEEVSDAAHECGRDVPVVSIPWADHSFAVPARAPLTRSAALDLVVRTVAASVLDTAID